MTAKKVLAFLTEGKDKMFRVITWTPQMAEEAFNKHNTHTQQRSFNLPTAQKYRRVMEAGEWRPAWPQCVLAFSRDGVLLNGQHTIWAIWKSGITIDVCTQWNLDREDFLLFDDFKSRNLAQLSKQAGLNHVNIRNGVAKMVMAIDHKHGREVVPTVADVVSITCDDALMNDVVMYVNGKSRFKEHTSHIAVTYALYKIALVNGLEIAMAFHDRVASGANLSETDPRLHLARYLRQHVVRAWDSRMHICIAIIRAFNAWATDTPMRVMSVRVTDTMPAVLLLPLVRSAAAKGMA